MCLLANRIQYSTLSPPFSPGTSHAVEFQKCLITLFNFKSVFINLFHSFIYFHRQFVIALSKPLTNFFLIAVLVQQFSLTMRWSPLNLSMPAPPPRSCVVRVINSSSQHTFSVGRQRKLRLPSDLYELYVKVMSIIGAVFLSKQGFYKNCGLLYIWKRWSTLNHTYQFLNNSR